MIEQLPDFPPGVLAVAYRGRVTAEDYESMLVPSVEALLALNARIRLYAEIGPDFEGLDAGALIDDLRIGIEHPTRWERVALVSDVEWIRAAAGLFGVLLPGRVKVFPLSEAQAARTWLLADRHPGD
jgi:hypothetical protein